MDRKLYLNIPNIILFGIAMSFFLMGQGLEIYYTPERNLANYQSQIEKRLHSLDSEVDKLMSNMDWVQRQYQEDTLDTQYQLEDMRLLQSLSDMDYNICFYSEGQLVFWSNNRVMLSEYQLADMIHMRQKSKVLSLSNGFYELRKYVVKVDKGSQDYAVALIPIYNKFALRSDYLQNKFAGLTGIPDAVRVSEHETPFEIRSKEGTVLTYITGFEDFKDTTQQKMLLLSYLLSSIFLGILLNKIAVSLVKDYKPMVGAAFLIVTVFCLRGLSLLFDFKGGFTDLNIFNESFNIPVVTSTLGDLLINIIILLWLMVFFHREFKLQNLVNINLPVKYFLTTTNYFSILLGMFMVASVFQSLILDSGIKFDFDNVFNLNIHSFFALIGIILLVFAHFLFSHRMILTNIKAGLPVNRRLLCIITAIILVMPINVYFNLGINKLSFALAGFVYIGLFDMFNEKRIPSLTWFIFWLVLLALLSAMLLYKYNNEKDVIQRIEYAEALAEWKDHSAEINLRKLNQLLDIKLNREIKEGRIKVGSVDSMLISRWIDLYYANNGYLFNNYAVKSQLFTIDISSEPKDWSKEHLRIYNEYISFDSFDYNNLRLWLGPKRKDFKYILRLVLVDEQNAIKNDIFLEVTRKQKSPSKVYTELLLNEQYKQLEDLGQYDYAIYKNEYLVESQGANYETTLHNGIEIPKAGQVVKTVDTFERSEVTYTSPDGKTVVIIAKDLGNILKPISLFSYLFLLLVASFLVLSGINKMTNALPRMLLESLPMKSSLGNKIQVSVIMLILTSFLFIGIVTVWFFKQSSQKYHEDRLERKVKAALRSVEHEIDIMGNDTPKYEILRNLVNPVSEIHSMDINLYNTNGDLINSSEEGIFKKGIISPKMGAFAFQMINRQDVSQGIQDEMVGSLSYKAAYVPVRNSYNEVIAYMGLPYYSKQRKLRSDVSDFMGTLINVYVFLLLLAGVVAISVAKEISRPITNLGYSLRSVQLGGKNKHISYKGEDEVGELIQEYNKMIVALESQSVKLANAEREGAWREMAKQVAHEIKNPLTPMKLKIQYMMHVYKNNPSEIGSLIEGVSDTLVEQIDTLENIATEFGNFAKMPDANNQEFELNTVVQHVSELFKTSDEKVNLTFFIDPNRHVVYADKNHFIRVLNNLIKNAIQSIPEDRFGRILVKMYREQNEVIIKVSDNGSGISEEMQSKVFKPYFTTKNSGTGLGLAISRKIIENVEGRIFFETEEGKGTDFYVIMPIVSVTR